MVTCASSQPTPVFWQPGYETNWKEFIKQTVSHFAGDKYIGYIRFGLGHGGEDLVDGGADAGPRKQMWGAEGDPTELMPHNQRKVGLQGAVGSAQQVMGGLHKLHRQTELRGPGGA